MRKIVVVTPVRNEEWILERFLAVTSHFADHIVVADQGSTDRSREICGRFSKVMLVENLSPDYDEGARQSLLLASARKRTPGPRLILALDADEILAADGADPSAWEQLRTAPDGTAFQFEKPDLLPGLRFCRRGPCNFPLGFADDGTAANGKTIHSPRIPLRPGQAIVAVPKVKFLHFALVRSHEYRARQRYYAAIENLRGTKPLLQRLAYYSPQVYERELYRNLEAVPPEWLDGWRRKGIGFDSFASSEINSYNREVLRLFRAHGTRKFRWDDLWDVDWRQLAAAFAPEFQDFSPAPPGWTVGAARSLLVGLIRWRLKLLVR